MNRIRILIDRIENHVLYHRLWGKLHLGIQSDIIKFIKTHDHKDYLNFESALREAYLKGELSKSKDVASDMETLLTMVNVGALKELSECTSCHRGSKNVTNRMR